MRVEQVVSMLKTSSVAPAYAEDLILLQTMYERILNQGPWEELHDTFHYQVEPSKTETDTWTGLVGNSFMEYGGPITMGYDELGKEFIHGEFPIMIIGFDKGNDIVYLDQPLTVALTNQPIPFFRRWYVPRNRDGRYMGKVRSTPSYGRRGAMAHQSTPQRLGPSAEYGHNLANITGATKFIYKQCPYINAPSYAPAISAVAAAGTPVHVGRYKAYTAYRMGPYVSELSPASPEFNYNPLVGGDIGTVTVQNNSDAEMLVLVEGVLEDVGCSTRQARSGLRVVGAVTGATTTATFEFDQNALARLPLYRGTHSALAVKYTGQPDERKNAAVNGWPRLDKIRSHFDEILLDERYLSVWRGLAKHMATGDGKHLAEAAFAMRNIRSGNARL